MLSRKPSQKLAPWTGKSVLLIGDTTKKAFSVITQPFFKNPDIFLLLDPKKQLLDPHMKEVILLIRFFPIQMPIVNGLAMNS